MTFPQSIYRHNRRKFFGAEDMSLVTILTQLILRSKLNPGKIYTERLERGLTVAFRTKYDKTTLQLSRLKPTEPSYLELVTCLKMLGITNPEELPSKALQDEHSFYLQVDLPEKGN
jgi:hypothetical protein